MDKTGASGRASLTKRDDAGRCGTHAIINDAAGRAPLEKNRRERESVMGQTLSWHFVKTYVVQQTGNIYIFFSDESLGRD